MCVCVLLNPCWNPQNLILIHWELGWTHLLGWSTKSFPSIPQPRTIFATSPWIDLAKRPMTRKPLVSHCVMAAWNTGRSNLGKSKNGETKGGQDDFNTFTKNGFWSDQVPNMTINEHIIWQVLRWQRLWPPTIFPAKTTMSNQLHFELRTNHPPNMALNKHDQQLLVHLSTILSTIDHHSKLHMFTQNLSQYSSIHVYHGLPIKFPNIPILLTNSDSTILWTIRIQAFIYEPFIY